MRLKVPSTKKVIVIGDTHIGLEKSEELRPFLETLDSNTIVVLLGDILDLLSPMSNYEVLKKYLETIRGLRCKIVYLYGNHDLLVAREWKMTKVHDIELEYRGRKYFLMHGYELEVTAELEMPIALYEKAMLLGSTLKGRIAKLAWMLWILYKTFSVRKTLSFSRLLSRKKLFRKAIELAEDRESRYHILGVPRDSYLIIGHLHIPYIGKYSACTGAWEKEKCTYLELTRRGPELKRWRP